MKKIWTLHLAAVMGFVVLGALALACAAAPPPQQQQPQQGGAAGGTAAHAPAPAPTGQPAAQQQQAAQPVGAASPYFSGNGGRGMTLAILEPAGNGLSEDQMRWMPALVQGSITGDFNLHSAITIVDRQNLETILDQQGLSMEGHFSDDDFIRIGQIANARYVLAGSITRTATAYMLEFAVTDVQTGVRRASRPPTPVAARALEDLSAVREATADMLGQLGVTLTARGRQALGRSADAAEVQAQTALARGITAQRQGLEMEALSHFMQANIYNPFLEEAESRLVVLTAGIARPPANLDPRGELLLRRQWMDRLQETEAFFRNYTDGRQSYFLAFNNDITQGAVNHANETIEMSFSISLVPDPVWVHTINDVVMTVENGLRATGRTGEWGIDWPTNPVSHISPFVGRTGNLAVVAEILNDRGIVIGRQTVNVPHGFAVRHGLVSPIRRWNGRVSFPSVDINQLTERLSVRIVSVDGVPAEDAARQRRVAVMPAEQLRLMPRVGGPTTDETLFSIRDDGTITAFRGNQTNVVIPSMVDGIWVTAIGSSSFDNRGLTSVTIPSGVRIIEGSAFLRNGRLTHVTIPDSVRTIGSNAFSRNPPWVDPFLHSITLGANVDLVECSINGAFLHAYNQNGRRAGVYTLSGNTWTFRPR